MAAKIERTLNTALGPDARVSLDVKASELLAEAAPVADVISRAFDAAASSLTRQLTLAQLFRRNGLETELIDALANPEPATRVAAARLCGALRVPASVPWLADMLDDPIPAVREAAARALGQAGGRRAVVALMEHAERIAPYRLAMALARAASDVDIESLVRKPSVPKAKLIVLMACGLRRDALLTPLLVRMALDRQCETDIRVAACRALAMIGDPAGADAMRLLATEPDTTVHKAAVRARMRISASMRRRTS